MRNTVLELLGSSHYEAMTIDELVDYLQIEGTEAFKEFVKLMVALEDEGVVVRSKNDRYDLARELGFYKRNYFYSSKRIWVCWNRWYGWRLYS